MAYRLFVNSADGVSIEPLYEYSEDDFKIEDSHRVRSGAFYRYKWGSVRKWKLPFTLVDSSFKSVVNSWFTSNAALLFKSESLSAVYSVYIMNKDLPVGQPVMPYDSLFKGVIELETY